MNRQIQCVSAPENGMFTPGKVYNTYPSDASATSRDNPDHFTVIDNLGRGRYMSADNLRFIVRNDCPRECILSYPQFAVFEFADTADQ